MFFGRCSLRKKQGPHPEGVYEQGMAGMIFFERGSLTEEIPPGMGFGFPVSFFKSISMILGRAGLIFEG
jgi:hypothetical protein